MPIQANRIWALLPGPALDRLESDTEIAKNYLNEHELDTLNRIVTIYLDFAELQAINRKPMYMQNWIEKLHDFLRISERDILTHTGSVSHDEALAKARTEYEKYRVLQEKVPSPVDQHFQKAVEELKRLGSWKEGEEK